MVVRVLILWGAIALAVALSLIVHRMRAGDGDELPDYRVVLGFVGSAYGLLLGLLVVFAVGHYPMLATEPRMRRLRSSRSTTRWGGPYGRTLISAPARAEVTLANCGHVRRSSFARTVQPSRPGRQRGAALGRRSSPRPSERAGYRPKVHTAVLAAAGGELEGDATVRCLAVA